MQCVFFRCPLNKGTHGHGIKEMYITVIHVLIKLNILLLWVFLDKWRSNNEIMKYLHYYNQNDHMISSIDFLLQYA